MKADFHWIKGIFMEAVRWVVAHWVEAVLIGCAGVGGGYAGGSYVLSKYEEEIQSILFEEGCQENKNNGVLGKLCGLDVSVDALREEVRSLGEVRGIDPAYLDMFPIIFTDNATLANCNTVDAEGVGAVLRTEHKAQLDRFIKTFKGCHKRAENGGEQLIRLEIRGYSSTAAFSYKPDFPFQCSPMTPELSDRLNTDAANTRAANVKDYLEDELARQHIQDNFKIDLKKWDTYDAIRRPYFDSREHPELDVPELINRSVFIRVTDAGTCDV